MTVTLTLREAMDRGVWDKFCEVTGVNQWAINEGADDASEYTLSLEQADTVFGPGNYWKPWASTPTKPVQKTDPAEIAAEWVSTYFDMNEVQRDISRQRIELAYSETLEAAESLYAYLDEATRIFSSGGQWHEDVRKALARWREVRGAE